MRHRALVAFVAAVGVAAYLIVVELGISAGRIHHGVRVGDVDVGGLTESEAVDRLREVGAKMRSEPVVFSAEGLIFAFIPREFGWLPLERVAARRASDVGRAGGLHVAAADRVRAWMSGVTIRWPDRLNNRRVGTRLRALERQAEALGYDLDRPEMRRRIKRAIWSWPREPFYDIPVERR